MSPEQMRKYRFQWSRVRKALVELGDFSPQDAEAERMKIHLDAIGEAKSSKDLTNPELNKILDAFDKILVLFDGPSDKPTRNAASLIWAIEQLGLDEPYIASIAFDQFKTPYWRTLTEDKLRIFRFTCTRASARRKP